MSHNFLTHVIKSLVLAFIYFEITNANDTTFENIIRFSIFYIAMIYGANLINIDPNVVTSAFLTKAVFTLVDEKIKDKDKNKNK
jgi:hypothetical protein